MATTLTSRNIFLGVVGAVLGGTAGYVAGSAFTKKNVSARNFAPEGLMYLGAIVGLIAIPAVASATPTPNPLSNTTPTQIPPAGAVGDS